MNFFRKFAELQLLMLQHNAGLTASHPYASGPINWPFVLSGISFWTEADSQKQIYLAGNVIGWWTCTIGLSIFVGVLGADLIARRRAMDPITDRMFLFFAISMDDDIFCSCAKSSVEQRRLFLPCMGCALCPILPDESSTFYSPLSAITPCFSPGRRRRAQFRFERNNQLSNLHRRQHYTEKAYAIL